jgi:hypothetical protein
MNGVSEEDYFNTLGMLGLLLYHVGGKAEIPFQTLTEIDLTKKKFVTWNDNNKDVFVFELRDV